MYSQLNLDERYQLVYQMDAREAMSLAQKDKAVARLLQNEEIWRAWFERDLQVAKLPYTNAQGDFVLPKWATQKQGKRPMWKRFYLWIRLAVSAVQWGVLNSAYVLAKVTGPLSSFPPGAKFRFLRLNKFELTTVSTDIETGETIVLDFRDQWPRMAQFLGRSQREVNSLQEYVYNNFKIFTPPGSIVARSFFDKNYIDDAREYMSKTIEVLGSLIDNELKRDPELRFTKFYSVYSTGTMYTIETIDALLADFPRMVEPTTILVGQHCTLCPNLATHTCVHADCQHTMFCSEQCHDKFTALNANIEDVDLNVLRQMAIGLPFRSLLALCTANRRMRELCELPAFRQAYAQRHKDEPDFINVLGRALENDNIDFIRRWLPEDVEQSEWTTYWYGNGRYRYLSNILDETGPMTQKLNVWQIANGLYYAFYNDGDFADAAIENNRLYPYESVREVDRELGNVGAPQSVSDWVTGNADSADELEKMMNDVIEWIFEVQ